MAETQPISQPAKRRWIGIALGSLAALFVIALMIAASVLFALNTSWGKTQIAAMISKTDSASIDSIDGSLFGTFTINGLSLSDPEGVWLKMPQARISWSAWPLLQRKVVVKDVAVPLIEVLRAPRSTDDPEAKPFELTDITAQPVSVILENLNVERVSWQSVSGQGASGQEGSVTVAARGRLDRNEEIDIIAALVPLTPGFDDEINADILLNTLEDFGSTEITLKASKGGLLASLMGLPGATDARIEGKGTPGKWAGLAKATIAGASVADITARYDAPDGRANGSIFAEPFINPDNLDLLSTPLTLDATFTKAETSVFDVAATLSNAAIQNAMDGSLSFVNRKPSTKNLKVTTALTGRIGDARLEDVETAVLLNGGLDALTAQINLSAKAIQTSAGRVEALKTNAAIERSLDALTADVSGTIADINGIDGLDPKVLQAIIFGANAKMTPGSETPLSASVTAKNKVMDLHVRDVQQNTTGAISGVVDAKIADLSLFPGAIDAAGKANAKLTQTSDGATQIKLTSTLSPKVGTQHWIGRLAKDTLKISANSRISAERISVTDLVVNSERTSIKGAARLENERIKATVSGQIAEAAFKDLVTGGTGAPATFDISALGPLETVLPTGSIALPGFAGGGLLFRDISLGLAPAQSGENGAVSLSMTGRSNAGPVNASARIQRLSGGGALIDDLQARLANVKASGNIIAPGGSDPKGTVRIEIVPVSYADSGLFGLSGNLDVTAQLNENDDGRLTFTGQGERLTYGPKDAPTAQMRDIALEGTVDLAKELPSLVAQVSAKALEAGGLYFDAFSLVSGLEGGIQKTAVTLEQAGARPTNAVLDITVTPQDQQTLISVQPSGTLAAYPFSSEAPLQLVIEGQTTTLQPATLAIGGGQIALSARQSPSNLSLETRINGVQIRTVTDLLQQPAYYGQLSADLTLNSQPSAGSLASTFTLKGLATQPNSKLAIALTGSAQTQDGMLATQITAAHNGETDELVADLTLPISWPETPSAPSPIADAPLSGTIALNTRLAPWWQLADMPDQILIGLLTADIELGGTLADVQPTGQIALTGARYENLEFGTQLEDMSAQVQLNKDSLSLTSLSAKDGRGGTLSASADVGLSPFIPQRSQILLSDFQLLAKEGLSARANADLGLEYENERLGLGGTVTIAEARYAIAATGAASVPILPIEEINKSALDGDEPGGIVTESEIETPAADAGLAPIDLDIKVTASRRIFVTGMGLTSEWRTDLDVEGTAQQPSIEGEIKLVRGELEFAGKRFQLERGQIYLDGGKEIDPRLDIVAENTQGDFTARIGITGTPSSPEIALSSTPALPDDEILSRILFGTSATDLSALEAVQLGSAVAALSSGGGSSALDIAGKARSATGLDRLSLGSNDSSTAITGGKYLSPDVYLQFTTDPSSGQYLAAIEWYVTRTLSLLSEYGAETGSNVAARWSRTY